MRLGTIFAAVVSFAFAVAITAVAFGPVFHNPALETWASQSIPAINTTEYEYQPQPGLTSFVGDFVWGLAKTISLFGPFYSF